MKVLFYGTYPNQAIGYSRVSNKITNYLANMDGIKVYHFGISNFKNTENIERYINPKITIIDALEEEKKNGTEYEIYGVNVFWNFVNKLKVDIVFLYNDSIVVNRLFNEKLKYVQNPKNHINFKIYTYIDLVYDYQRYDLLNNIKIHSDKIFVFSNYWKEHLKNILGIDECYVIKHGVEKTNILKSNKECKELFNLKEDDFVVLNTNRNAYRKAWDITFNGFLLFLKSRNFDKRIKLYVNSRLNQREGFNMLDVIKTMCFIHNIDYNNIVMNHILTSNNQLSDKYMEYLYNACDVGINTCIGEGFGLCSIEHAFYEKPQIVSKVGGLKDIFEDVGDMAFLQKQELFYINNLLDEHNGIGYLSCPYELCSKLNYVYDNYEKCVSKYKEFVKNNVNKYDWDNVLSELKNHF